MDEKEQLRNEFRELKKEYEYKVPDIWDDSDDRIRKIKWIIETKLTTVDRTIFLLYCETASLRKLGKILGVSHSTIRPEVNRIKENILDELYKIENVTTL